MKTSIFIFLAIISAFCTFSFISPTTKLHTSFKVDPKKSTVVWTGKKVSGAHTGNVAISNGSITADGKTIKGGTFEIDMNSITCTDLTDPDYNQKLVGHLKGDDFFATDKFPKSVFTITKVTPKSGNEYEVNGKLTIKGMANDVTFPATISVTDKEIKAMGKITVDRTKYGIKYGSGSFFDDLGDKAIDNDFILDFTLVANK